MAAEQKARAVYENLINLTDDPDVIGPLLWLRQREVVHFARFKELYDYYKKKMNKTEDNTIVSNNYIVNQLMGEYPYR
jgi:spore coat protein JC